MFAVEIYAAVRSFVFTKGNSRREAARVFGLSRETVLKMCRFSLPPGYTRTAPVAKPKLGALLPVIDAILEADRTAPVKQRHTAKRIFERLSTAANTASEHAISAMRCSPLGPRFPLIHPLTARSLARVQRMMSFAERPVAAISPRSALPISRA